MIWRRTSLRTILLASTSLKVVDRAYNVHLRIYSRVSRRCIIPSIVCRYVMDKRATEGYVMDAVLYEKFPCFRTCVSGHSCGTLTKPHIFRILVRSERILRRFPPYILKSDFLKPHAGEYVMGSNAECEASIPAEALVESHTSCLAKPSSYVLHPEGRLDCPPARASHPTKSPI